MWGFGLLSLQMLLAASHVAYGKVIKKRVSEHSYFRTHLQACFESGGIAKPLYSTYEEKLAYLRKMCLRYGGKPAPQPPVFEKK